jgi:hypothetical protein
MFAAIKWKTKKEKIPCTAVLNVMSVYVLPLVLKFTIHKENFGKNKNKFIIKISSVIMFTHYNYYNLSYV